MTRKRTSSKNMNVALAAVGQRRGLLSSIQQDGDPAGHGRKEEVHCREQPPRRRIEEISRANPNRAGTNNPARRGEQA